MRRSRLLVISILAGIALGLVPLPAPALSAPRTLAGRMTLGSLDGLSKIVTPSFAVEYVGVGWRSGSAPSIRFLSASGWSAFTALEAERDGSGGMRWSDLAAAGRASAYQLRGKATGVRAVAINTHDGARSLRLRPVHAEGASQPAVISRAAWGADESLRFKADGTEDWPQTWFATRKLLVHHTATANNDPDPAATVRAIYRYHAVDQGYGDIGYNFLVDAGGHIYKGRYSGPLGTQTADTLTGENAAGQGVTAAHAGGWNSGTMGIAMLGTYTSTTPSNAAVDALVGHLAWEAQDDGIDPQATETFVNPVSGATITTQNIAGHRDYAATECPGGAFYAMLPEIRNRVAAAIAGPPPPADTTAPTTPAGLTAQRTKKKTSLTWQASTDAGGSGLAGYEVWRATSSTGPFSKVATMTATSYSDALPRRGTTYRYYVVAYDGAGNDSAPSNTVSVSG